MFRLFPLLHRAFLALALMSFGGPAAAEGPLVFAAASLKTALDAVAEQWRAEGGQRVALSYAGSPALARQIELGAPADIFISADLAWMDWLAERGLIRAESRRDLLGNRLVLIAQGAAPTPPEIAAGFELGERLGDGRLAMALTRAVPAGRYGKAALTSLGLWDQVEDRLAEAENVRVALALVARGEAPLGIVYASDAEAEPRVGVVGRFPAASHPPIVYVAALTAASAQPAAPSFLEHLGSAEARGLFERQGFTPLP